MNCSAFAVMRMTEPTVLPVGFLFGHAFLETRGCEASETMYPQECRNVRENNSELKWIRKSY